MIKLPSHFSPRILCGVKPVLYLYKTNAVLCESPCESLIEAEERNSNVVAEKKIYPAKKEAPLSACSKERLIMTVRESHLKCSQLETELKRLKETSKDRTRWGRSITSPVKLK